MQSRILILLSAYNGSDYISEQLDSILHQSNGEWTLIVRDDGSTDNTVAIINEYASKDHRIKYMTDDDKHLGAKDSFAKLMLYARDNYNASYIMFADQDDVWLPMKIAKTLDEMLKLEGRHSVDVPLLAHSDLRLVDKSLSKIHGSFLEFSGLCGDVDNPLRVLLWHNFVTGCTVMINRQLLQKALPVPTNVKMHDWWCALIAGAYGFIGFIPEPTILYRQHGINAIGARRYMHGILHALREWKAVDKKLERKKELAMALQSIKADPLNDSNEIMNFFVNYELHSRLGRLQYICKYKILPQGLLRVTLILLGILTVKKKP